MAWIPLFPCRSLPRHISSFWIIFSRILYFYASRKSNIPQQKTKRTGKNLQAAQRLFFIFFVIFFTKLLQSGETREKFELKNLSAMPPPLHGTEVVFPRTHCHHTYRALGRAWRAPVQVATDSRVICRLLGYAPPQTTPLSSASSGSRRRWNHFEIF